MPDLGSIRARLAHHKPSRSRPPERPSTEAAVALLLYEPRGGKPELFFIERARRDGDPWSGHMAFPGGRRDACDKDLEVTAARETFEEVGIELGSPIGQLDEFSGTRNPRAPHLVVTPFVYELQSRPETVPNHEVNDTVWIPLRWILSPDSAVRYSVERASESSSFPAIRYQRFTVWGLTYRVLGNFLEILGRELPSDQDG